MRKQKIFDTRAVILLLIAAILLGFILNALLICIDRLIYPDDYYDIVMKYSGQYSVPPELVFAIIKVESNFKSDAKSHAGAIGLMQMLPSTYIWLAEDKLNEVAFAAMLHDPDINIKYGTYYLQYLYAKFGSWEKVIIAYNWGEGNFSEFLEQEGYEEGDYSSIPVTETKNYIRKVMHHWGKYNELYSEK